MVFFQSLFLMSFYYLCSKSKKALCECPETGQNIAAPPEKSTTTTVNLRSPSGRSPKTGLNCEYQPLILFNIKSGCPCRSYVVYAIRIQTSPIAACKSYNGLASLKTYNGQIFRNFLPEMRSCKGLFRC